MFKVSSLGPYAEWDENNKFEIASESLKAESGWEWG